MYINGLHYVRKLHSSTSLFEIVQAMQSADVGVVGLHLSLTVILRSVDDEDAGDDTFLVRFLVNRKIPVGLTRESETPPSYFRHGRMCPFDDDRAGPDSHLNL